MKSRPRTETSFLLQHLDARLALLVSGPDPQKRRDCELVLAD